MSTANHHLHGRLDRDLHEHEIEIEGEKHGAKLFKTCDLDLDPMLDPQPATATRTATWLLQPHPAATGRKQQASKQATPAQTDTGKSEWNSHSREIVFEKWIFHTSYTLQSSSWLWVDQTHTKISI
jgi:hypothetical protein